MLQVTVHTADEAGGENTDIDVSVTLFGPSPDLKVSTLPEPLLLVNWDATKCELERTPG